MPKSRNKRWVMPEWMEKYQSLFNNTGGNTIEDIMNREDVTIFNNAPMALICVAVKSQVSLLTTLHENGVLGITLHDNFGPIVE